MLHNGIATSYQKTASRAWELDPSLHAPRLRVDGKHRVARQSLPIEIGGVAMSDNGLHAILRGNDISIIRIRVTTDLNLRCADHT